MKLGVATLWGFAESTLFFLVPDIWLTVAGREKLRTGLIACLYALLGALIGGALMYLWAANDPEGSRSIVEKVPAVSPRMMERVEGELADQGVLAVLLGPLTGTPYKTYAVHAESAGIGLLSFLLISIPARLIRFVLVTVVVHYVLKGFAKLGLRAHPLWPLFLAWTIFYIWYFWVMPN